MNAAHYFMRYVLEIDTNYYITTYYSKRNVLYNNIIMVYIIIRYLPQQLKHDDRSDYIYTSLFFVLNKSYYKECQVGIINRH